MGTQAVGWKPRRREEIVSLARDGKITADDAEAEAAAKGWEPFEREPDLPAFDPLLESRWSIVMALAWIAWRDIGRVRAYCSGFQSQSKHWVRREWNARTEDGSSTPPRAGWVRESWPEPTTSRLWLHEQDLKKNDRLPLTAQMSVLEAEQVLWKALADGHLVGEAIDQNATPIDVPQREWSYLKHFEERERDVVKYHPNDPRPAFRDIKLKRNELMQLWPAAADNPVVSEPSTLIEPMMLEPMVRAPAAGYVPLCVALHWIMTRGGTRNVHVDDADAWGAAVGELHSLICDERVELIGRPRDSSLTRQFPGHSFPS